MEELNGHWADNHARRIVKLFPDREVYVCASGITPSGRKHIGNFREIITVELVVRALRDLGKKVRFIYSWDAFDRFRGIPKDLDEDVKKKLEIEIGKPDSEVIDPWGCHKNWALHWQEFLERECKMIGIKPEFLYQDKIFKKCTYWEGIRKVMQERVEVAKILNESRREALPKNWYPLFVYCEKCLKDTTKILSYDEETTIEYSCKCGYTDKIDFSKKGIVKPPWRVDWAIRWAFYDEAFEPSGKDHMVKGSSAESAGKIVERIFKKVPPHRFMYDFVLPKGMGGKMSASKGNVITTEDVVNVYLPEIVRFFFAGTKPNKEFAIPFDDEIFKVYEDFYRSERIYFGKEEVNEKKKKQLSRVYELSQIDKPPKKMPEQPKFSYCAEMINLFGGDVGKSWEKIKELGIGTDETRWKNILERAKVWVEKYADDKYRFEVRDKIDFQLNTKEKVVINGLIKILEKEIPEDELGSMMYSLVKNSRLGTKDSFKLIYRILVNKEKGPRLAPFIKAIGEKKVKKILESV
jgi:lysyl-tRNA synthetase, class I